MTEHISDTVLNLIRVILKTKKLFGGDEAIGYQLRGIILQQFHIPLKTPPLMSPSICLQLLLWTKISNHTHKKQRKMMAVETVQNKPLNKKETNVH